MRARGRKAKSETLGWAIDLGNGHFVGRYWGDPVTLIPRNYSGYRSAVFETRRIACEALKTVGTLYGFWSARVVRVKVTIRRVP